MRHEAKYDVPGLRAGLEVLKVLCGAPSGLGAADIAERTGLNRQMVFRCLRTLAAEGWVSEISAGPKYSASLLGFHYLSKPVARMDLMSLAMPTLGDLWEELGECVYLSVIHRDMMMMIYHRDGRRQTRIGGTIGELYLPYASAPGKVLMAFGDEALVKSWNRKGYKPLTEKTIISADAMRRELKRVREQGFATDNEEYSVGGICYAAPVFDYSGKVTAALGTTVLTVHYSLAELQSVLGPKIQTAARTISIALGDGAHAGLKIEIA